MKGIKPREYGEPPFGGPIPPRLLIGLSAEWDYETPTPWQLVTLNALNRRAAWNNPLLPLPIFMGVRKHQPRETKHVRSTRVRKGRAAELARRAHGVFVS